MFFLCYVLKNNMISIPTQSILHKKGSILHKVPYIYCSFWLKTLA